MRSGRRRRGGVPYLLHLREYRFPWPGGGAGPGCGLVRDLVGALLRRCVRSGGVFGDYANSGHESQPAAAAFQDDLVLLAGDLVGYRYRQPAETVVPAAAEWYILAPDAGGRDASVVLRTPQQFQHVSGGRFDIDRQRDVPIAQPEVSHARIRLGAFVEAYPRKLPGIVGRKCER